MCKLVEDLKNKEPVYSGAACVFGVSAKTRDMIFSG